MMDGGGGGVEGVGERDSAGERSVRAQNVNITTDTNMIARSELEAEVAMLRRELASITASADRSRELAARLEDESHELKSRIESARHEEERDRKTAVELEEELADLADEVNGQLDELERINGTGGGLGKAVGKALLRTASSFGSASFGDAVSVGGRSRASSAGGSLVEEVQSRFEDACSIGEGTLDNTLANETSSRGTRDGTSIQVRQSKDSSGNSSSHTKHPSTGRPASALQQQWEAAYSNSADIPERPTRSTSRGSAGYDSGERMRRYVNQSRREDEQGGLVASRSSRNSGRKTRSYMSSMTSSAPTSPQRGAGRESDVDRRRETFRKQQSAADSGDMNDSWRARQESLTKSFHSLFKSLGQEVDKD
jgi:hypothetical protein